MSTHMKKQISILFMALTVLGCAFPVLADITNNLVAYYNFEGLTGIVGETIVDQTGNGHDGICRQDQSTLKAPTIVSGPKGLGDALNFDGSFYVQIPNAAGFNITDNITLAAGSRWIRSTRTGRPCSAAGIGPGVCIGRAQRITRRFT